MFFPVCILCIPGYLYLVWTISIQSLPLRSVDRRPEVPARSQTSCFLLVVNWNGWWDCKMSGRAAADTSTAAMSETFSEYCETQTVLCFIFSVSCVPGPFMSVWVSLFSMASLLGHQLLGQVLQAKLYFTALHSAQWFLLVVNPVHSTLHSIDYNFWCANQITTEFLPCYWADLSMVDIW